MAIMKKVKEFFKKPAEAKEKEEESKQGNLDKQFRLGEAKETEVVETICMMVEDCKSSRAEWLARRAEGIRLYEGIKAPKNKPWPGSSNISTMVTTVAADLLHAKLYPMVWNQDTLHWKGRESHDTVVAENVKDIMAFVVSPAEMEFELTVDDIVQKLVVEGTVIGKIRWGEYFTYVTRVEPKGELTPSQIINGKIEYEVKYDYVRREKAYVDLKDLERTYFPYEQHYRDDENELEYIIDELWYTLSDLRELKARGLVRQDIDLEGLSAAMDELPEFSATAKERQEAEGATPTNTRKENYKLKCYEGYIKHDVNNDNIREECVFLVVENPKYYLAGKPLHAISRIGKRPWVIRPFLRRPGRTVGKGIPDLTMNLHNELDAVHNQRIDAGNMAIAPFFFYRPSSGSTPDTITVGPATGVPVDDPVRDITFPTFPSFGLQVGFQEERIIMELIERLTFLTPAMMGKELASRPTVRGTLAVMSQGEQKFALLARRMQGIVSAFLTQIKQKYEENLPPEIEKRILGKDGERVFKTLSPEMIAGQYDCVMALDLTAGNMGAVREINTIVYQMMAFDPFVQQNPAYGWEVRADWLRSMNKEDKIEKIIGPKPETLVNEKDADDIFNQLIQEHNISPEGKPIDIKVINRLLELKNSEEFEKATAAARVNVNRYIMLAKVEYAEQMRERMQNAAQISGQTTGFRDAFGAAGAPGVGTTAGVNPAGPVQPGGQTPSGGGSPGPGV